MRIFEDTIKSSRPNRCCRCGCLKTTTGCLPCLLKLIGRVQEESEDNTPDSLYVQNLELECAKVKAQRWNESTQLSSHLLGEDVLRFRSGGRYVQFPQFQHAKRNEAWDEMHDQPYWQDDLRYTNV